MYQINMLQSLNLYFMCNKLLQFLKCALKMSIFVKSIGSNKHLIQPREETFAHKYN